MKKSKTKRKGAARIWKDTIQKGDMAMCSQKQVGLVLSDKPEKVTYNDGTTGIAWTGIHLSKEKFGEPWSSRNPVFVASMMQNNF